ncbi:MAG: hypothetical protein ACK4KW_03565 [Gemmobacter sp.]
MTIHTPVGEGGLPGDEISEARELFDIAAQIMRRVLEEMRAAPAESARELATSTKDVRDTLKLLVAERANLEKLRGDAGALGGPGRYDFDAARDEIGRRLACLRDAGGGG